MSAELPKYNIDNTFNKRPYERVENMYISEQMFYPPANESLPIYTTAFAKNLETNTYELVVFSEAMKSVKSPFGPQILSMEIDIDGDGNIKGLIDEFLEAYYVNEEGHMYALTYETVKQRPNIALLVDVAHINGPEYRILNSSETSKLNLNSKQYPFQINWMETLQRYIEGREGDRELNAKDIYEQPLISAKR